MKEIGLTERFERALTMATGLHRAQIRKGTERTPVPYLAHLLEVTAIVLGESVPEDVVIAALLHDGPKDAGGLPVRDQIRERFGDRVAQIVDGSTDAHQTPKPPWIERKEQYLARLGRSDDFDILLVKCADCLSNARATLRDYRLMGDDVWNRFTGMPCASCQRSWYASVREALRPLGQSASCFAELDQAVSALLNETRPSDSTDHVHMPIAPSADLRSTFRWPEDTYLVITIPKASTSTMTSRSSARGRTKRDGLRLGPLEQRAWMPGITWFMHPRRVSLRAQRTRGRSIR